jgi:hypothetical protein
MKKLLLIATMVISAITINAQTRTASATFEKLEHDFGNINEEKGSVSVDFHFKNMGGTPLLLKDVHASCGCTSPNWSKEPVLPGAKGFINVSYNPAGRPGRFEKTVTVTTNGDPEVVTLKIIGNVVPKPKTIEDDYPALISGLRFKSNSIAFPAINFGNVATNNAEVYNPTDKPVNITFTEVPAHIIVKAKPETLGPKQEGAIEVTYNSAIKNDYGTQFDGLIILVDGKQTGMSRFGISAQIIEDFSQLTPEQRANAPVISFENSTYDFDTIKQGTVATYSFKFKNTGKSDLIVRKVATSCGCTAAELKTKLIKPGDSESINVSFNSTGRSGTQNKTINVISNDPVTPRVTLWIKGIVK